MMKGRLTDWLAGWLVGFLQIGKSPWLRSTLRASHLRKHSREKQKRKITDRSRELDARFFLSCCYLFFFSLIQVFFDYKQQIININSTNNNSSRHHKSSDGPKFGRAPWSISPPTSLAYFFFFFERKTTTSPLLDQHYPSRPCLLVSIFFRGGGLFPAQLYSLFRRDDLDRNDRHTHITYLPSPGFSLSLERMYMHMFAKRGSV